MEGLTIREIVDQVLRGQIRIPAFQRGFVWEPDRVAYLMDSIYKMYPFGSLLFWRTREKLKFERDLGPFVLPEPKADYPVDYVLDGQQRVTSIFGVFQNDLKMENKNSWLNIFFDTKAESGAQDTQFVALSDSEADPGRYFPMKALFDTVAYRTATKDLKDEEAKRIDEMQSVFKEMRVPVQYSATEDRATVAIIFERVNRQGVALDTLQLLSAWTWSEEFALQEQFSDLADELEPFGFKDVGEDTTLLLRCCSAVLTGDASPEALITLNGAKVRASFDQIMNGVKYAVDYMRVHFAAEQLANLPFSTMLIPLAVFFAVPGTKEAKYTGDQRAQINRWFWRSAFSKRYSSGVIRNLNTDIEEMRKLKDEEPSALGEFGYSIEPVFFLENTFGMGSVNTKTFILMLAQNKPLSFISGAPIDLAKTLKQSNRTEFHHMMPRDFLKQTGQTNLNDSLLANMCFLSRSDNRELGGVAPSEYRKKMPVDAKEIFDRALSDEATLLKDSYDVFLAERALRLVAFAKTLCS
ncbi:MULTISPECIES: DUF262 domain-containing protein [unclassified Bradyrhizobium]|uniref:GmrSD restriction endonuclease domain-containing protein n=1 Tax=unclassified Bradyrhizobium TaxID=2631580 RepID=UPI003399B4FF